MKRLALNFFVILICIISFTSCSKKEEEPVEITFIHGWGSTEPDHVAMRNIYMDFEKENPDVHINMLSMPTNAQMIRKVEDMIAIGNIPDVIFTAGEGINSIYSFMYDNNMLTDISSYTTEDKELADSISPITYETWTDNNGSLYTASDVLILSGGYWYNKTIFEQAGINKIPQTWDEFDEMLTRLESWTLQNENQVASIMPSTDAYLYMVNDLLYEQGKLSNRGDLELSKSSFEKMCYQWEKIYSHINPDSGQYSYRDEVAAFNDNQLAIFINGIWGASMINSDIKVGYALLPFDNGTSISCQTAALGYLIGNTGDKKRTEASVRFLKYMLSEPVQERILLETQQMPSNPNINISDHYSSLERFCLAAETVQQADVRIDISQITWSENQRELIDKYLPKYLAGEESLKEFEEIMGLGK